MRPTDLALFRSYTSPAVTSDGQVVAALTTPNVDDDRYDGTLHRLVDGLPAVQLTRGPRDSAPVLSPNGEVLVFLRAGTSGPAQPYAMLCRGGEPFQLASHPLGVSEVTFSPDGRRIAYLAPVPEPGRYGTPASANSDADGGGPSSADSGNAADPGPEAPRRITSRSYRADGKGFILDRLEQVFVLDLLAEDGSALSDSVPRQLTNETVPIGRPTFTSDGEAVVYVRATDIDAQTSAIAVIPANTAEPGTGDSVVIPRGDASVPVVSGDIIYYIGTEFEGHDFAGRSPGLWAVPLAGGAPRRLTDAATVFVDASVSDPAPCGDAILVAVQERGAVSIRAVPTRANAADLVSLPVVLGGNRAVKSFRVCDGQLGAVVAAPDSCGDIVTGDVGQLLADPTGSGELRLTDVSADLRADGVAPMVELTGTAPDGYPVHGWAVLPPVRFTAPHPVLLNVHGGPHAQYGWAVFDEAQTYAAAGYAVVMGNPRGSSGYGESHGRAPVGALGTVDADDVLALLDTALRRDDLDAARVGVMGGSYGGFMTSWLASQAPGRFVAGISERAVNAWDSFTGTSDIGYFFAEAYVGSDPEVQRSRSPLYHVDDIGLPLLIIHSEQDWRCPLEQAQRLFVALKSRGAEAEMLVFPGEGHELSRSGRPRHRVARLQAILEWWARYLPVR